MYACLYVSQRSPRRPSWWGGGWLSPPAFGPSGLRLRGSCWTRVPEWRNQNLVRMTVVSVAAEMSILLEETVSCTCRTCCSFSCMKRFWVYVSLSVCLSVCVVRLSVCLSVCVCSTWQQKARHGWENSVYLSTLGGTLWLCLSVCVSVYLSVCMCVVHDNRKLGIDDRPLSICLRWVEHCGCNVRGLDRHQFILVENDASAIDVSDMIISCVVSLAVQHWSWYNVSVHISVAGSCNCFQGNLRTYLIRNFTGNMSSWYQCFNHKTQNCNYPVHCVS